jgi:hypothetical protein
MSDMPPLEPHATLMKDYVAYVDGIRVQSSTIYWTHGATHWTRGATSQGAPIKYEFHIRWNLGESYHLER